ncbi:O100 family O-antigen flippase [Photorhabdus noenieputensis]|uniref:oligosaccharide flippase family protein n=1 Tax=Photorhabdus noenieputensis TaxID=1208607 RepID=UPI001BD235F9|nr:oligosaccharide flippase family protein [Photorhabdus noenieputensis]MBS9436681.1 O100 family O-antigen flippase [Photorhabdus noenieputensis]MCK3669457.1 oligosaccharide flippase family protein [Photorhabdus noenieputensis]
MKEAITKNSVLSNINALFITQIANYLSLLLIFPYLSRILGIDGFGKIGISLSIISIFLILTDYGFNLSAPSWIANNKKNINKTCEYIGAIFILKILLTTLGIMLLFIFTYSHDTLLTDIKLIVSIALCATFQSMQPTWFFQGIEKMRKITYYTIIAKAIYMILVLFFVKNPGQEWLVIFFQAISFCLSSSIAIYFIYREGYTIRLISNPRIIKVFKESTWFFISRAAVCVYTSASTLIIGSAAGVQQAGLYSSSEKIYNAGQGIISPISQAIYPYLSRSGDKRFLYKISFIIAIPMIIGCYVITSFSSDILTIFYGPSFSSAAPILNIFLFCLIINYISVNFGYPAFSIIKRLDIANKTVILGALLQLINLIILFYTESINAINISLAILIVEIIVMIVRVVIFISLINRPQ